MKQVMIYFSRACFEDGFGFLLMKKAYSLDVKGIMDYGPGIHARIIAQGDPGKIEAFIQWLRSELGDKDVQQSDDPKEDGKVYSEFDIFLHTPKSTIVKNEIN